MSACQERARYGRITATRGGRDLSDDALDNVMSTDGEKQERPSLAPGSSSPRRHSHAAGRRRHTFFDARLVRWTWRGAWLGMLAWLVTSYLSISDPFPVGRPPPAARGRPVPAAAVAPDADQITVALTTAAYCLPLWLIGGAACGASARILLSRRWYRRRETHHGERRSHRRRRRSVVSSP